MRLLVDIGQVGMLFDKATWKLMGVNRFTPKEQSNDDSVRFFLDMELPEIWL